MLSCHMRRQVVCRPGFWRESWGNQACWDLVYTLVLHNRLAAIITGIVCCGLEQQIPSHPASSVGCCFSCHCHFLAACRNGSALVKEVREKKDKDKSRLRFWDMAGSKMGQITGLTNDEQADAAKRAEEQVSFVVPCVCLHGGGWRCCKLCAIQSSNRGVSGILVGRAALPHQPCTRGVFTVHRGM